MWQHPNRQAARRRHEDVREVQLWNVHGGLIGSHQRRVTGGHASTSAAVLTADIAEYRATTDQDDLFRVGVRDQQGLHDEAGLLLTGVIRPE